ncbi:MAG: hypothetical protein KF832_09835 [Caldilineaceae bacterium]|nr:hypothetical protein [Caldilineaceae bacterium]
MPKKQITQLLSAFLVATILWLQLPIHVSAQGGTADYTFGDCSTVDQDRLRAEIEQVAHEVLADQSTRINIDAIVMRQWVGLRVDDAIDREVKRAVDQVYASEGYWSRLWSGWSADKAEEFATQIANDAFGSESFHTTINELSTAIAQEISQEIEADFARAASAAFLCMKAYVGDKYSGTLFSAFEDKVSTEVSTVNVQATSDVDVSALDVHQKALGGVGVIIVTELSRRIAVKLSEKIAERVAGKIVGRIIGKAGSSLIPVAGWVIGLGLIVWDLWEGGNGALPQIQDALQSEEVKAKIRQEVSDSIKDGLPEEVSIVSLEIAVSLVEDWNRFCDTNRAVCTLAQDDATFQDILNYTPLDQVGKLVSLVNAFMDNLGRAELEKAIDNGQFEKLLVLPEAAFTLLAATKSASTTLAWAELAGDRLPKLVELELYQAKAPSDFTPELLRTVLNLESVELANKVAPLDQAALTTLTTFAGGNFVRLVNRLSAEELSELTNYLATASPAPSAQVAARLASGDLTVAALLNESTATTPATIAPTVTPSLTSFPAATVIWQFIYTNSIAVAFSVILVAAVLLALISSLGRRHPTKPISQSQPPKVKKQKRKPRHVYDIFPDDRG